MATDPYDDLDTRGVFYAVHEPSDPTWLRLIAIGTTVVLIPVLAAVFMAGC